MSVPRAWLGSTAGPLGCESLAEAGATQGRTGRLFGTSFNPGAKVGRECWRSEILCCPTGIAAR